MEVCYNVHLNKDMLATQHTLESLQGEDCHQLQEDI